VSRANRWKSDSQANAEALDRRERTYSEASGQSFQVRWQFDKRIPTTLREATDMIRQAYADEVPTKLHEGPDSIGEGGTPKMAGRFVAYLDNDDGAGYARRDPETGERPALDFMQTPFRGTLAAYEPARAAIVEKVAIGSMGPIQAAIEMGVPAPFARLVAEDTLFGFLRNLSDVKVNLAKRQPEAA
jgi:hypothetical protein